MVKRIPNPYQVVYEDGPAWRTVHLNHAKPAKLTAADLPAPTPTPEPHQPALGYIPRSLQRPRPRQPPPLLQAAAPAGGASSPPTASVPTPPSASQQPTREATSANGNSAPLSSPSTTEIEPPASLRANENAGSSFRPQRSAQLNPQAYAIKSPPKAPAPQSLLSETVARTYPLSLEFNQCLGAKEDPYSFSSIYLEDLRNDDTECLSTIQQLIEAIP